MSENAFYDFCVIGSGIVGLTTTLKLSQKYPKSSIVILEKENDCALHQSSHNSGVVHSGIYYQPDSLKANFCKKGSKKLISFCKKYNIKFQNCGKLIVALNSEEEKILRNLMSQAKLNEVKVRYIKIQELKKLEPNIEGIAALLVPSTSIVNYYDVAKKIEEILKRKNINIKYNTKVIKIKESDNFVKIKSKSNVFLAKKLIVCGGLQADRLAKLAGLKINFKIIPFKGEYYQLNSLKSDLINHLVYPVPNPKLPFLGVHFTKLLGGGISVGPNAVISFSREGYSKFFINLYDIFSYLFYSGFWRVIWKFKNNILKELMSSVSKNQYLKHCQKYYPELKIGELSNYSFGIRAQMVKLDGSLNQDFEILKTKKMIHVCSAPSPAATSSFAIAEYIVDQIQDSNLNK